MKQKDKLNLTSKYMIIGICICFVVALVVGVLVIKLAYPFDTILKYTIGLILSTLFSFLRIILMKKSVERTVEKETTSSAKNAYQLDFFTRQILIVVFLVVVFMLRDYIGLVGILVGMFFVKISGFIANFLLTRYENKAKEPSQS